MDDSIKTDKLLKAPIFSGMSAYRSIISLQLLDGKNLNNFVKWWGPTPQSQIVMFLINRGKEFFVFATMPEVSGGIESWSKEGDIGALRSHLANFMVMQRLCSTLVMKRCKLHSMSETHLVGGPRVP